MVESAHLVKDRQDDQTMMRNKYKRVKERQDDQFFFLEAGDS